MQPFNLDTWIKDKSRKVVTRDGRSVRIVCWDVKSSSPIIGIIQDSLGGEFARNYALNGRYSTQNESEYDIFFADEEEELTEFEKELNRIVIAFSDAHAYMDKDEIHHYSKGLLDLARKENCLICKEYSRGYQEGLKLGREDALKDLPKLEESDAIIDKTIPVMYTNAATMKTYVEYDGYKACINDLFEKLLKEE